MTLKELQELEEKGVRTFAVFEKIVAEFKEKVTPEVKVKKSLELFGAGVPCFEIYNNNEEQLFYMRNVVTNPRQPSPIFLKINSKYKEYFLNLLVQYQEEIEVAVGVKVVFRTEEEI